MLTVSPQLESDLEGGSNTTGVDKRTTRCKRAIFFAVSIVDLWRKGGSPF